MAVNITVDNAVIDYTAITSILQNLKSHDDLFTQIATSNVVDFVTYPTANASTNPPTTSPLAIGAVLMEAVQATGAISGKTASVTVKWSSPFLNAPVVVATPMYSNVSSSPAPSVYISTVDTSGATIIVSDSSVGTGTQFLLNVFAIGPRAASGA